MDCPPGQKYSADNGEFFARLLALPQSALATKRGVAANPWSAS